jgi:flagellar hook-associated protein 3 FlgL
MRVTQTGFYNQATKQMAEQQSKVFETQAQLSSGKKRLRPSDDPALAASLNNLKSQISVNQRYLTNLGRIGDTLKMQEASVSGAVGIVSSIKELSIQGANGTYSAADRKNIAIEIKGLRPRQYARHGWRLFVFWLQPRPSTVCTICIGCG